MLATNIAETSLTIPGVRIVVDSGLVRRSVFDPSTGMSRLETQRISRASADQRQGRAGRVEAGVCYRAWSEGAQRSLAPFSPPEITDADLTPLALDLANWGVRDATDLRWLDAPPNAMLASARDLLAHLGALDQQGRITPHGREMAALGVHPRLAHMLLRARDLGALPMAADFAALLSERDLLRGAAGSRDADVRSRLDIFRSDRAPPGVDWGAFQRAKKMSRDLYRRLSGRASRRQRARGPTLHVHPGRSALDVDAGVLLAFAYPDRIGRRRAGGDARYTLANGRGAHFADTQSLGRQDLIVAVDLDDRERDARILLAAPLARADLDKYFADQDRAQRIRRVELARSGRHRTPRRAPRRRDARRATAPRNPRRRRPRRHARRRPRARYRRLQLDPRRPRPAGPHGVRARNARAAASAVARRRRRVARLRPSTNGSHPGSTASRGKTTSRASP